MTILISDTLVRQLRERLNNNGTIVVLSGAGISAESAIPTFRGKEGYWTVGSKEYHPQEMATQAMFQIRPQEVWAWYLYRRNVCNKAQPNAGHLALAEMEKMLDNRFQLITQNVDGLHLRAGNSPEHTYQIHGNVNFMRCSRECTEQVWAVPGELDGEPEKKTDLLPDQAALLRCPECGSWTRPHILWFDEYYNEAFYHYESSIQKAVSATVLVVIGTSGATNLPMQVGYRAAQAHALIIDINIEANPFSQMAEEKDGFFLKGQSAAILPDLVKAMH